MKTKTEKPLIFFDLETTGTNISKDRIVQISAIKTINDKEIDRIDHLINPEMIIPQEAIDVHKITNEMVKDAPTFSFLAPMLFVFFNGDLAGFNQINFDVPLLSEEFHRAGFDFPSEDVLFVDVKNIFHKKEKRDLSSALKFYCGKDHDDAHSAIGDVLATMEILKAMKRKYSDLPADRKELNDFCFGGNPIVDISGKLTRNEKNQIVYNFGRYAGERVDQLPSYANWILQNDFPRNTKSIIRKIMEGGLK